LLIIIKGLLIDTFTISIPFCWSKFSPFNVSNTFEAYNKAEPPPGTIPSSAAALVAHKASLILSFNSPTSTSDEPPTFKTATPPVSLPSLSCSFSLS
jgi:hypothetical protein